jgi:UDP-N-acetylenolpyruvoylglucosamine reductase
MVEVDEVAALSAVLEEADGAGRPVLVLGGGSNLVGGASGDKRCSR